MTAPEPFVPPVVPPVPRASRDRTMVYLGAGIAIAVAAVLIIVLVVPPSAGSNGTVGSIFTFSGAKAVADRTLSGFQGGGWTGLLLAVGLVSPTNESFPTNTSFFNNIPGCKYTPVTNLSGLVLPGFSGNRSAGEAPAWEFAYTNSEFTIALVSVIDGHGSVLGTLGGFECSIEAQFIASVPTGAVDSTQAAAAVRPAAAGFLAVHPNASAAFSLTGALSVPGHSAPAEWTVTYTTCSAGSGTTGTGAVFNATVDPLTGAVLTTHTNNSVTCGSQPILVSAGGHGPGPSGVPELGADVRCSRPGRR